MNSIVLSGVVSKEPELRYVPGSGKAVCKFALAVKKKYKPQNGPDADFHECQLWGKQAESFAQYNQKGARVAVKGELNDNNYEAQDGTKRYGKIVNCDHWEFNGSKKETQQHESNNSGSQTDPDGFQSIEDDDDIPF